MQIVYLQKMVRIRKLIQRVFYSDEYIRVVVYMVLDGKLLLRIVVDDYGIIKFIFFRYVLKKKKGGKWVRCSNKKL